MEDAMLGFGVQVLVDKAISLATEEIDRVLGFKKDLRDLRRSMNRIKAVLHDAERQQVRKEAVKLWLEELEGVAFDADNVLDEFNYELLRRNVEIRNQMMRKVCFFFSRYNPIAFRIKMAHKILEINTNLEKFNKRALEFGLQSQSGGVDTTLLPPSSGLRINRETDSTTVDSCFVGRDDNVSEIVEKLTAMSDDVVSVLPIVGMGGIGKTTLARNIFKDVKIKNHFDKRIWVYVSEKFEVNRLLGLIIESLTGQNPGVEGREAKAKLVHKELEGKRFLLVIDDMWNEQSALWNDFLGSLRGTNTAKGNYILVTTRKQQVATITAMSSSPCSLKKLSDERCWLILKENAFGCGEVPKELQDTGFQIAKKCHGLPLAASVLGGMLRNKGRDEWLSVLEVGLQNIGGDENSINDILKLSFDHLPSPSLKKCFAYCSIFPKGFDLERVQLIQLWMAEGFLHSNPSCNMDMEEIGEVFFSILLQSNLLQDAEKDEHGNVSGCKMHDLVHDLAKRISNSKIISSTDCRGGDDDDDGSPIQYLALNRSGKEIVSPLNEKFRCLTTLFFLENKIDDSLISRFMNFRVLNLSLSGIEELPKSIGKLFHLRYLNLADTKMRVLPESICKLYNLQTLNLKNCSHLMEFPYNFKNLVNLRHLETSIESSSSKSMPLEVGRLTCLRTLPFFNLGKEKGRQIEELKHLKNLSGSLVIHNLELLSSKEEAENANLVGKSNIFDLTFVWNSGDDQDFDVLEGQRPHPKLESLTMEGLRPHPNLKSLTIRNFMGDQLSSWITKLDNLVSLKLKCCRSCKELPALGHMPSLRSLELIALHGITTIRPSFYGGSTGHNGSSRGDKNLFPALKHLKMEKMENLIEWMGVDVAFPSTAHVNMVFPSLEEVEISKCYQLATVPSHFPSLKKLEVKGIKNGSHMITKICNQVTTLTSLSLKNVDDFIELPNWLWRNNPNLTSLVLQNCPHLKQVFDFDSGIANLDIQNTKLPLSRSHHVDLRPFGMEKILIAVLSFGRWGNLRRTEVTVVPPRSAESS